MKAFKQININFENRLVFSYAAILCFLCSLIVLNPLFGQGQKTTDSSRPEVKIDVQEEYDANGNITGIDSTYVWYWSDKEFITQNLDSIFKNLGEDFNQFEDYLSRNHFKPFNHLHHPEWQWNKIDSSLYSDIFDKEFIDQFNFNNEYFSFYDSTITSYFDFQEFNQQFNEKHSDFLERLKNYQKEHQKLFKKYFGESFNEENPDVKYDQQKNAPQKNNSKNEVRI